MTSARPPRRAAACAVPLVPLAALALAALAAAPLAAPLAAQHPTEAPAQDSAPRPTPIPASGPVPAEPAAEQRLRTEVTVPEGFEVTLFAGPPVAMYPTCVAEGPDGAVFVCVDPNLSLSVLKGVGRVMRLVDGDGDGRADRYTTFAEMDSPRGVVADGNTVYVMHPPNLTAYRDTTGDGIADVTQTLVRGLGFDLDFRGADHTTNGITMGPDGWIYVAVGDYGFEKAVGADGRQIRHRGGAVVRVRPDGTHLEIYAVGTRNIYDLAVDPFGRPYTRDNTNDGDGWDTRLHYVAPGADLGYPALYKNFATEHFPTLHDYGAGSGTAGLWIQSAGWPDSLDNALYTGDWTVNKIFRHSLSPKGAAFGIEQHDFVTVPRPADMIVDADANLFVASLSGGQFTYSADTVGYVFRLRPAGRRAALPRVATLQGPQLVAALRSPDAVHRTHAQHALLRRPADDATVRGLEQLARDAGQSPESRAAAIFTLKPLAGARAHATLAALAADADARVREVALRALADRPDELDGVSPDPFVRALGDPDFHVRVQAITGLVRMGAVDAAGAILPLVGSDDQGLRHLAVNALVRLGARDVALRGLDGDSPAVREGALRVLQRMHDPATVTALVTRAERAAGTAARRPLLSALARLYHREGVWAGDWWTTKPSPIGPYFDPAAWEGSARIRPVLRDALVAASGDELRGLVADYVANRVLPRGAEPLVLAVSEGRDPQRARVLEALVGQSQLGGAAVELVVELDRRSPALHGAVAQLLAGESSFGVRVLPLVRGAVLDSALDATLRGQLLTALGQMPGREGLDAAAEVFARLNPVPGMPAAATPEAAAAAAPTPPAGSPAASAVEAAWRRFVGDRRRTGELDYFIERARTGEPGQRTLAYAVLVQAVRSPRTSAAVREQVAPVLDAAWADEAAAPHLVQAIRLMRVESQYAERLQAYDDRRR